MPFTSHNSAISERYDFSNLTAKGAGAYVFWVIVFGNATTAVTSVVSNRGRAMKRMGRVTSANRAMEVWSILHSPLDTSFYPEVSQNVDSSFATFIAHGIDTKNPFGTVVTKVNNAETSLQSIITDGVYDSYVLEFFGSSVLGDLTPGSGQVQIGSVNTDLTVDTSLSVSRQETYHGVDASVSHSSSFTGELLQLAFVVRSMARRDPDYLAALQDETRERSFLTEIGAAEDTREGWTFEGGLVAGIAGTATTSQVSSFTHTIPNPGAPKLLLVNVFSTTASTGVTYKGIPLRKIVRSVDIEFWYLLIPDFDITGTIVVSNIGTIKHIIARTMTGFNNVVPIVLETNTIQATGLSIPSWAPGFPTTAWKDIAIVDAAEITGAPVVSAKYWGEGQTTHSNVAVGGNTFVSSSMVLGNHFSFPDIPIYDGGGWTFVSGGPQNFNRVAIGLAPGRSTQVWSKIFTRVITGGDNKSGIQRNFDHLEVNGYEQLKQTLLDPLHGLGAEGSYFYDEDTDKIYFRTSTGANPNTFASVTAEFFILVGNRLVDFIGGDYYDPRLTGQLPSISGQSTDLVFGVTSYPNGSIDVLNTDKFFDAYSTQWYWKNREVKFFFGSSGMTRDQYRQVGGMLIDDVQAGYDVLAFQLRAQGNALQSNLLTATFGSWFAPFELGESVVTSDFLPYTIGRVDSVEATFLIQQGVSGFPWKYFPGTISSTMSVIRGVRAIHRTTGEISHLSFINDWFFFSSTIGLTLTYDPAIYIIIVDIGGEPAYAGETLRQLLLLAGVPLHQIDAHAFALVDEDPVEVAIYQNEQVTVEEAVRLIEKSTFKQIYVTADGLWSVRDWLPSSEDFDVIPAISESNLKEIPKPHFQPITPFFEFVVQYGYQPFFKTYKEESSVALETIGLYKTQETFFRRTCLVNYEDAYLLAIRCHGIQLAKPVTYELEEIGFNLLDLVIFDKFRFSLQRAPSATGSFTDEIMQVLEFTKTFNPEGIHVVVDNLRGLGAGVKVSAPDGTADWDLADAESRIRYAYAADDATERVNPVDPSTEGQAFAW